MTKEISKIAKELKDSPMFNLSLSSKELFHSNFLSWIGNNKDQEMKNLFQFILRKFINNDESFSFEGTLTVNREEKNTDISIENKDGRKIIIENKVKSIPYYYQLKKYEDANNSKRDKFVLLSLFQVDKDDFPNWESKTYKDLYNALYEFNVSENITNVYNREILVDYQKYIKNLNEMSEISSYKGDEKFFYNKQNCIYETIVKENIRLENFYIKSKYTSIAFELKKRLKKIFDIDVKFRKKDLITSGSIYIEYDITHGEGLFGLKFKAKKDFVFLIQIQGAKYGRGFESLKIAEDENIKEIRPDEVIENWGESSPEKEWVNFKGKDSEVHPKSAKKEYCQYSNNKIPVFKYKYIKIPKTTKTEDLLNDIIEDCKTCLEFCEK